jgi:hypothetical protein
MIAVVTINTECSARCKRAASAFAFKPIVQPDLLLTRACVARNSRNLRYISL